MAIPTKFDITFQCGHTETRDLSSKPAGKRLGFANWLGQNGDCTECWKKSRQTEDHDTALTDANENATIMGLPDLVGTDRQLEWAPIFRNNMVLAAHRHYVQGENAEMTEDEFESRIMEHARKIVHAGWWMDNSQFEPEDIEELVTTALDPESEVIEYGINENPYF